MKLLISFLLLPLTAFGALTVTDRGTGTDNSSTASMTPAPTSTIAAGSAGVLNISIDNANGASTNLPLSATDTAGNTWYLRETGTGGSANANVETAQYSGRMVTQLTSAGNVTITFTTANVTAKSWTFVEVAPAAGKIALFKATTGTPTSGATTSSTIASVTNVSVGDVCIAMVGAQNGTPGFTGDSDTSNGNWSTAQTTAVGSGTAGIGILSQQKVQTTAASGQTFNTTLTSSSWRSDYIIFGEADPKARGSSDAASSSTTAVIGFAQPLAIGSIGVIAIAVDNNGTSGTTQNLPSSMSDTKSNTWTLQQTHIYNISGVGSGVEAGIYTSVLTAGLVPSDTVTCTFPVAVSAKVWTVWEFAPSGAGSMTYVTGAGPAGASTGTPSVTTTSIALNDYVIGMTGSEGIDTFTPDAGTTNGTWSSQINNSVGAGSNAMAITTQFKQVSAAATQVYAPTLTSADTQQLWIEVNDSSPVGPTAQQKAAFFMLFP